MLSPLWGTYKTNMTQLRNGQWIHISMTTPFELTSLPPSNDKHTPPIGPRACYMLCRVLDMTQHHNCQERTNEKILAEFTFFYIVQHYLISFLCSLEEAYLVIALLERTWHDDWLDWLEKTNNKIL